MTIDQIREIVISPDAIMKKEWGKVLLDEIDRLTAYSRKLLDENIDFANEINRLKARVEKAEAFIDLLIVEFQDSMDEKLFYEMLNGYIKEMNNARKEILLQLEEGEKAKVKQVFFLEIGEFWDTPDVKKMFSAFETAKNEVPKNFVEGTIDGYLYYAATPKGEEIGRYAIITKYPIEDLIIA